MMASQSKSSLSALFTDEAKEKFARVFSATQADEVIQETLNKQRNSHAKQLEDTVEDVPLPAGKKKRRLRERGTIVDAKNAASEREPATTTVTAPVTTCDASNEIDGGDSMNNDNDKSTIFVGNLSTATTVKDLKRHFKDIGTILNVRLRSAPVAGTAVDQSGNQNLVRRVCVNQRKYGDQKQSLNAYICFSDESVVQAAIKRFNNTLLDGRHIRVDTAAASFDPSMSVFIGNLPYYADEEAIREFFAVVLPNGQDSITGIRIPRDKETLKGRGFGYLLLADRESVLRAMTLDKAVFKKRWPLRVTACGKRTKRSAGKSSKNVDQNSSSSSNSSDGNVGAKRRREEVDSLKRKKLKPNLINTNNALKRIKLKGASTRSKVLKDRGQKRSKAGAMKGKRLGGTVKRVLKASSLKTQKKMMKKQ